MLPSRAVNIFFRILNVNKMHRLHYVWFQNNPGQVNALAFCIPNIQTLSCNSLEPMVNRARLDSVQSISFEISAVIKQNHPLTSSIKCFSIIQRVIMILNQSNQLFYIKVLYFKMKSKFWLPPRGRRGISFASHAGDRGSIPGRDRPKL